MDKHDDNRRPKKWKEDNRHMRLYDDKNDRHGSSTGDVDKSSRLSRNEIAANNLNQNLPEDMRISKLLKRLETEQTTTGLIEICEKLKIVVQDPANANYMRRKIDNLANSIINIMKDCSIEAVDHLAEVFGLIGYAVPFEFQFYKSWICKTFKSTKSLRPAMMKALEKTLKLDEDYGKLADQITRLMELLRDFLEKEDNHESFIAITQVLLVIAQNYTRQFKPHFTNIVDIIIGWHIESHQAKDVKHHCSVALQCFQTCWENDPDFSLDLLRNLSEDIDSCIQKLDKGEVDRQKVFREFGSFIGVFNTIIKCVMQTPESLVYFVSKEFLDATSEKVVEFAKISLAECEQEELVMSINEFILIIVACRNCDVEIQMNDIQEIIELQIDSLKNYSSDQLSSFLTILLKFIEEFKGNLDVQLIKTIFDINGALTNEVRFNDDKRVKNGLIRLYHEILTLKSVPILQTAFMYIVADLGACLREIPELRKFMWTSDVVEFDQEPENSKISISKAQYSLNFNLVALSKLATMQNSIIVMYSLSPSILEVLINFHIWEPEWNQYEVVQYAVLRSIASHCIKNNNFVSSSLLFIDKSQSQPANSWLSNSSPTESPSSNHFKLILEFLGKMLKHLPTLPQFKVIVDWIEKIVQQTTRFSEQLAQNQQFVFIVKRMNEVSVNYNDEISLLVANCDDLLSSFDTLHPDIFTSMAELCSVQLCSVNSEIRKRYSFILSRVPLRFTLEQAKSPSGINKSSMLKTSEMENWHLSLGALHGGELRAQYFKEFINHITLSPEATDIDDFILRAFKNCWFNGTDKAEEYKMVTLQDIRLLTSWIQWEAARYCVNNKLRTPLGKAQETIVKIENIIKEYARVLALKDTTRRKSYKNVLANQRNARILLGFMESLEKAIYNAAEGNAFGIQSPEKPAKTFFRLNHATCNEWFTRNRLAIHLISLHCMELEMVIRCSTSVLKDMVIAGKQNEPYFDQILVSLVWAFLRNFESDALFGLYTWVKHVTGRKLLWIKMVAEQACGHREIAADGYTKILKDEKFNSQLFDFINDQRKICLMFSGNFEELYRILVDEENRGVKTENIPILTCTAEQVSCILHYEKTRDPTVLQDISSWETLEAGSDVSSNFSVHKLLSLSENTLSMGFIEETTYVDELQEASQEIFHTLLQECLRTHSQEYLIYFNVLNHLSHKGVTRSHSGGIKNIESFEIKKKFGALTMYMVSAWSEYIDDVSLKGEQQAIDLRLDLISCARKELNYRQCNKELMRAYEKIDYAEQVGLPLENSSVNEIRDFLMMQQCTENASIWTENVTRTIYEHCKIIYIAQNEHTDAIQLAASTSWAIDNRLKSKEFQSTEKLKRNCVKFNLKIAEWIQNESDELIAVSLNSISPLRVLTDSINRDDYYVCDKMPSVDAAVGKLLQSGAKKCPNLTKVWFALGGWCYRWGRKMVESKTDSHGLQPVEKNAILELLPNARNDDVENILKVLNEQQAVAEDEDIGPNEMSCTELIESQLRLIPSLKDRDMEFMNSLIDLWKNAHREVYRYYEMCASSYFKFLLLSSNDSEVAEDSSAVTATLRLLRLIVKHALSLQDVLEEGLSETPSDPWKVIIPQLFSRLNHHEPYVRRRVSELLCRVAVDSPHLIIFPTVVGAQETMLDVINIAKEEHDRNAENECQNSSLTFCFNSLLETLTLESPKTVSQVQLMVRELRRVSILWDELWLLSLSQIYADNIKRFQAFNNDWQKGDQSSDKSFIFTEKYRLLMRPVVFVLERLQEHTTMRNPETNNERQFQKMYSKVIEITINEMRKPFDQSEPLAGFNKFKSLYQLIQQRVQRKINYTMKMNDISPELANLQNTFISMPGVQPLHEHEAVYIQSVDNLVQILPTKTKPKKLAFIGSDGKRYTYLFKGMEDLHLDERIMQFLSIANLMMKDSIDSDGKITHYRAHHYSVIPLGPRSGLISWVDGVTPIFSIYKKWQQREAANPRKDKQFTVMRPSEMFMSKITPLLKEHNIKLTDNRRDWPLSVQRKVFEELKSETPKDLFAKEFWCTASTASHWRRIIRNYSVSLAVMSVIGYIIGLGDRHLDNVLVKLATGDVVHIDYNVCFEKGKTLRVPERVSFRMTQNIEEALGLTGIEGTFRLSCEHVLKSLKRGRETLLTLLEAFVYDPLVDWAVGEDSTTTGGLANLGSSTTTTEKGSHNSKMVLTAACKQLEREVTRDALAIRFTEMKSEWMQNRDDISNQLLFMKTHLNDLSSNRDDILKFETQRIIRSKQISLVRELEALSSAMSSHPLNTLSQRYAICKKKRNDCEMMRTILNEKVVQLETVLEDYVKFQNDINQGKLTQLNNVVDGEVSEFVMIKDFLESSNQGQLFMECDQLRNELNDSLYRRNQVLLDSIQIMTQYANIIEFYPQNHVENHRLTKFSLWCRLLLENNSPESTKHVITEFRSMFDEKVVGEQSENMSSVCFHLQTYLTKLRYQRDICMSNLYVLEKQSKNDRSFEDLKQEFGEFINRMNNDGNPILHELCKLTKRMETVEIEIFNHNQEILGDLLINDRWHIDEVKIQMTFLNSLIDVIMRNSTNPLASSIVKLFQTLTETVDNLNTSLASFCVEIIPLTLKSIITEDKSTMSMISRLNSISRPDLINILNQDLLDVNNEGITRAQNVIEGYKMMVDEYQHMSDCLAKKVFLSLDKIFNEITKNTTEIAVNSFKVPTEWLNFLELERAKNIMTNLTPSTISTLEQIVLVEKIKTMLDFFSICLEITLALKGSGAMLNLDPEYLCRPFKQFIGNYYSRLVLGRASFCLSSIICCLHVNNNKQLQSLDQIRMEITGNKNCEKYFMMLEEKLRTEEFIQFSRYSAEKRGEYIEIISGLFNTFQWLHEDALKLNPTPRHSLLIQLQNRIQTLSSWKTSIAKIDDELQQCTIVVLQRLKWAAGVNPSVNESMKSFEMISNSKSVELEKDKMKADEVMRNCCAILNYEMMRYKSTNAILTDEEFASLLKRWESVNVALKIVANTINPIEESLVELLDPEGSVDRDWIEKVTSLIDDIIHKAHSDIDSKEKNVALSRDKLDVCAHKLRNFISTHHRLSTDVKNLLKSILKQQQQQDESEQVKALRDYLDKYKTFMTNVTELHGNVLSKDFTDSLVKRTSLLVDDSLAVINDVYSDLFKFETTISTVLLNESGGEQQRNAIEEFPGSPMKKGITTHKEQKRNAYAVSVWRRIRMKLEGRDPDPNKTSRVQEQIDWMIKEATNQDNLALLYEGFTAWV